MRQPAEGDAREHLVRILPEQRSVFTAPPAEALKRHQRIVVLGDPGSGKTTVLCHLALREAQEGGEAPVYVEPRKYVDSGAGDLLTYVVHVLAEDYRFRRGHRVHRGVVLWDGCRPIALVRSPKAR